MKNIWKLFGALSLLGAVTYWAQAAQTCQRTDYLCFESGPSQNLSTPFRVDSGGNLTANGNILNGPAGIGLANTLTQPNESLQVPVLVSTPVLQGMAIVATTQLVPGFVNGVLSTTSGATSVLGIADVGASSGAVVNIDYSGISLALTSGTITVGDLLVSTVTWPGYLVTNNSAAAGAIVATALSTQASSYNGLTRVLIHH